MGLEVVERQRRRLRARALPVYENDDEVLTFKEWININKISAQTGRRILKSGTGPIVTALSAKRIGITRGANRAWQASRARS